MNKNSKDNELEKILAGMVQSFLGQAVPTKHILILRAVSEIKGLYHEP